MNDIQYYVLISKDTTTSSSADRIEIDKIDIECKNTKLPFSEKFVDIYLTTDNKKECEEYVNKLQGDIQKYFQIEQIGSEIQYTAFVDLRNMMILKL